MSRLDEIKARAEAATPGPCTRQRVKPTCSVVHARRRVGVRLTNWSGSVPPRNTPTEKPRKR